MVRLMKLMESIPGSMLIRNNRQHQEGRFACIDQMVRHKFRRNKNTLTVLPDISNGVQAVEQIKLGNRDKW